MSSQCRTGRSDARHSGSGDIEEGITLDVPLFSSLLFTSCFFRSWPSRNGVGMGLHHL